MQNKNGCLESSDLFHMFTQSIKFYIYISLSRIEECVCLKNVIYQIDSKNESLLFSACFSAKFGLVFALTLENSFSGKLENEVPF